MRSNFHINEIWRLGGPFIGPDGRSHGRVTVQAPWSFDPDNSLITSIDGAEAGIYANPTPTPEGFYGQASAITGGLPLRWFQNFANDQVEIEVPNVKTIQINRDVGQDAATCDIEMYNQQHYPNDAVPASATELGQPGYFTFSRGDSAESRMRWGHVANSWNNVLVPNAILRTYQGYGGNNKTIPQALADDNLILTGLWFIDEVNITAKGMLSIKCRDAMKLLIEQQLYPPLVPKIRYPLKYFRWRFYSEKLKSAARQGTTAGAVPGDRNTVYDTSNTDAWYGNNAQLHGHRGTDALDGNSDTYWLSVGDITAEADFATSYIQFQCGQDVNAAYVWPFQGNYTMYVSVMVGGVWQGSDIVPYDPAQLFATGNAPYGAVDTGAAIPYVASYGMPWETPQEYVFPALYHADFVRLSFRNEQYTEWGPFHYRSGVREAMLRVSAGGPQVMGTVTYQPLFFGASSAADGVGYFTTSTWGQVDAFGDGRSYDQPVAGQPIDPDAGYTQVIPTHTGLGYYLLSGNGRVTCYGDAAYHGDPFNDGWAAQNGSNGLCWDMAITVSGNGYWVLDDAGHLFEYGDAASYTDPGPTPAGMLWFGIQSRRSGSNGVWLMRSDGLVVVRGAAVHYGNWTGVITGGTNDVISIAINQAQTGYWLLNQQGVVQTKGSAAVNPNSAPAPDANANQWFAKYWRIIPTVTDHYNILRGDGTIINCSSLDEFFGSAIPGGESTKRTDGNYKDYVDIIRDLVLWSGFLLFDAENVGPNDEPPVFGNLESTGAYAPTDLPDNLFDKRPVIEAITQIKETVGYHVWVDDEGGFRFEAPNWFAPGNFDESGNRLTIVPEVDERLQLIDYSVHFSDDSLRSIIIMSSEDPDARLTETVTTRLIPTTAKQLKGLVKPAMWINGWFQDPKEQQIMAELIALHIYFGARVGQVTCAANPCIGINDQVRIWERQTSEAFIHYVRGVSTNHDLETGQYTMTLNTNWLGDGTPLGWAIQPQNTEIGDAIVFQISDVLRRWFDTSPALAIKYFAADKTLHTTTPGS